MTNIPGSCACAGDVLIDQLQAEFGAIMAARIIEAEATDFYWDARVKERYLGQVWDAGEDDAELARVAIMSSLGGAWHVAAALVDGEGSPVDLLWRRSFEAERDAELAFARAH